MTTIETLQEILRQQNIQVPEESLEMFRDLVDAQADMILDQWLEAKKDREGCKIDL